MTEHPNILLFIPHDLGDHLGCYGHRTVQSPNLDALAAAGVRFSNCFTTSPECTPSRGGLYTGLMPHQNGLMGLSNFGWQLQVPHLAEHLQNAGYATHHFGVQHETDGDVHKLGYNELHAQDKRDAADICKTLSEFLHTRPSGPWFACAGFFDVHRPWGDASRPRTIDPAAVDVPPYLPDTPEIRADLALFHQNITEMDAAVGSVLHTLSNLPEAENTLILFTTDHGCGFPRAKATLYDPGLRVPLILHWPGQIAGGLVHECLLSNLDITPTLIELAGSRPPGKLAGRSFLPLLTRSNYQERNEVSGALFYDVSYDPMHYIRTATHKYIRSFAVTPEDANGADREVLCTFQAGQWVRVDDYDVMHNQSWRSMAGPFPPPPREELYDLTSDPLEQHNLADTPTARPILEAMRQRLQDMMERTHSPLRNGGHVAPPEKQKEAHRHYRPGGPAYR